MASIYSSTNRGWQLRLDWSITGQSINDNTSTLSLDLWIYDGTGYSQNQDANQAYYILQGEKRWNPYYYSTTGWYKLGSKSITVSHNADGTGSVTLTAEWDCGFDSSYTPRHLSLSETVTLATIPRASSVSASGDTLGQAVAITISRASSSFTHKLYYSCGSISWAGIASDVDTSYRWTPPVSLAAQAPNASAVVLSVIVETYNGSTYIGMSSVQMTLAVPSSVVPTLSVATSDPTMVSATYGGYVQLRSKIKVDLTASGAQGSTIKAYSIKLGDIYAVAAASGTTDYLPTAGALTLTCTVTDSRGRTTTKTQTITVLAYSKPTISDIAAARCNSDGTANRMGDYGKVTFSGAITALSNKNTAAYAVQYREVGTGIWSNAGSTAAGNYAPSGAYVVFAADKSKRYEVRVVATDAFEAIGSAVRDLPAAYALLHHAKHLLSMGIGRLCDKANALQVGLKAYFDEDVQVNGNLTTNGEFRCAWMKTTAATDLGQTPKKVAVINDEGWIYYRTPAELLADMGADYIVEQGKSGIWTCRKWASGAAECWAKITQTVTPGEAWAGTLNLAPYVITVTTPIEFTGIDCVNASAYVGNGHTITSSVSATPPNKISIPALSLYLTGQQECRVYVHVMGRWK